MTEREQEMLGGATGFAAVMVAVAAIGLIVVAWFRRRKGTR